MSNIQILHGLTRVRGFTQDDAHIFCAPEQLNEELVKIVKFAVDMLKVFGFEEYGVYLSTRPEKYIGTIEIWDKSTWKDLSGSCLSIMPLPFLSGSRLFKL